MISINESIPSAFVTRKKNILISCMALTVGGGEILPMSLAAELSKNNQVFLFYHMDLDEDEGLVKRLIPKEVKVLSMKRVHFLHFFAKNIHSLLRSMNIRWSAYDFFRLRLLDYYVRKYSIDIISSHSMISDEACCQLFYKKKPVIVTEHGQYVQHIAKGIKSFVGYLKRATKIIAVSNYNRKLLLNELNDVPVEVETIYNGIKREEMSVGDFRKDHGISDDTFVFGMVSRGIPEKGWKFAIESFLKLKSETSKKTLLVLVGGSMYLDELKERYTNEASIVFVGSVPNPSYYVKGFDIGLLPTVYEAESFPLAIIEYLFEEKPVIATDTGGIREMLCDDKIEAGRLIQLQESECLFKENISLAMKEYMVNEALYKDHRVNTAKLAQRFTIEECSRNYEKLFDEILDSPSSRKT
ncbi:MAG: glycosyltransferase family 4 protein [Bacteroidetes bacterium]|nr:MAG: glycosyltransferase family 4 protein [Bacteroidota bacterium]